MDVSILLFSAQREVDSVVDIMRDNMGKVLDRSAKLDDLEDKSGMKTLVMHSYQKYNGYVYLGTVAYKQKTIHSWYKHTVRDFRGFFVLLTPTLFLACTVIVFLLTFLSTCRYMYTNIYVWIYVNEWME